MPVSKDLRGPQDHQVPVDRMDSPVRRGNRVIAVSLAHRE